MVPPRVLLLFVSPGWLLSNSSEDSNGAVLRVVFACHDALRFAVVAVVAAVAASAAPFVFACCSQDKWDESVGGTFAVAAVAVFAAAINSDSDGNGTVLRAAAVAAAAAVPVAPPVCLGVADVKDEDGDSAVADAVVAATPLP